MANYVLVHGAWQNARSWDLISGDLGAKGNQVYTPERKPVSANTTLESQSEELLDAVTDLSSFILVAHSYAGAIALNTLDALRDRLEGLALLDAFFPEPGESSYDRFPERYQKKFSAIAKDNGGWLMPGGESKLNIWGLEEGPARDHAAECMRDFSFACFKGVVSYDPANLEGIPKKYVQARSPRFDARDTFEPFADKAEKSGWEVHRLDLGHECQIEAPGAILSILASF